MVSIGDMTRQYVKRLKHSYSVNRFGCLLTEMPSFSVTRSDVSLLEHAHCHCVAFRLLLGFGRLISYHRNSLGGRTSIIARPGEAAE